VSRQSERKTNHNKKIHQGITPWKYVKPVYGNNSRKIHQGITTTLDSSSLVPLFIKAICI